MQGQMFSSHSVVYWLFNNLMFYVGIIHLAYIRMTPLSVVHVFPPRVTIAGYFCELALQICSFSIGLNTTTNFIFKIQTYLTPSLVRSIFVKSSCINIDSFRVIGIYLTSSNFSVVQQSVVVLLECNMS